MSVNKAGIGSRRDPTQQMPIRGALTGSDLGSGGALLATLHAYAAADLNAKQAAEQLHIYVNTAHYRLARIAERTGCDLRSVRDVIEPLIAGRLAAL